MGGIAARLQSKWRDGKPNVGAKVYWLADWHTSGKLFGERTAPFMFYSMQNQAPPQENITTPWKADSKDFFTGGSPEEMFAVDEGVGETDANGQFRLLSSPSTLFGKLPRRATVYWTAEIVANDSKGRMVETGGGVARYQSAENVLGVRFVHSQDDNGLITEVRSWDIDGTETHEIPVRTAIYQVDIKTVRKRVGSISLPKGHSLVSFLNTPVFRKVSVIEGVTPTRDTFDTKESGHYELGLLKPSS